MSTFDYFVAKGSHRSREDGMCSMEWTAFLAGEPHSDSPACVSPLLRAFGVDFNDMLDDDVRQRLRPYLARMIGTAGDGRDEERAWLCADWLVRVYVPVWLDLAGLTVVAARLRALPAVASPEAFQHAGPVLTEARLQATAARTAAWAPAQADCSDVAGAAARAACAAAGTVARTVARFAAWTAAQDPAWAAGTVAAAAAQDVAAAAAQDVALDAALDAAWAAGAAPRAALVAAEDALRPTVVGLQRSAFDLLDRMLPTEPLALPTVETANGARVPVGVR